MKKTLVIFSVLLLAGCMKKHGPDASMVMQGDILRLPPEYTLRAPSDVQTIKTTPESVDIATQEILLKGKSTDKDAKLNTWLLNNAGGQGRIKNIDKVLEDDIKKEKADD